MFKELKTKQCDICKVKAATSFGFNLDDDAMSKLLDASDEDISAMLDKKIEAGNVIYTCHDCYQELKKQKYEQ